MILFSKSTSVKRALLTLLLPASISLMATAWLVHGLLLERMSQEFLESRLKDEVAFLEHHIRQAGGQIDSLPTGGILKKYFIMPLLFNPRLKQLYPHSLGSRYSIRC